MSEVAIAWEEMLTDQAWLIQNLKREFKFQLDTYRCHLNKLVRNDLTISINRTKLIAESLKAHHHVARNLQELVERHTDRKLILTDLKSAHYWRLAGLEEMDTQDYLGLHYHLMYDTCELWKVITESVNTPPDILAIFARGVQYNTQLMFSYRAEVGEPRLVQLRATHENLLSLAEDARASILL